MDFLSFLRDFLPRSPWSLAAILSGVVAIVLLRVFQWLYEERIKKLNGLLDVERSFSTRFREQLEVVSEDADSELQNAWGHIEELQRQVAIIEGAAVPHDHALDVLSRTAKVCAGMGGDDARDRLVSIWTEAGLAVGREIRWKLWYRPSRVPKMLKMALEDAPPPRRRTDAIVFHILRSAWSATIQSMVFMAMSTMPQAAVDYLKDSAVTARDFSDYLGDVAKSRISDVTGALGETWWEAFTLGASLGMSGEEFQPDKEYVLEEARPDPTA